MRRVGDGSRTNLSNSVAATDRQATRSRQKKRAPQSRKKKKRDRASSDSMDLERQYNSGTDNDEETDDSEEADSSDDG